MLELVDENRPGTGDDEAGVAGRRRPCLRAVKVQDGPVKLVRERGEQVLLPTVRGPVRITTGSSLMRWGTTSASRRGRSPLIAFMHVRMPCGVTRERLTFSET